jgi:BolA protein
MSNPIENNIRTRLTQVFSPLRLELENESHKHAVAPGSETHFKVLIVSEKFNGLSRVARQRLVNDALKSEFVMGLHALAQRTLTPAEWQKDASREFNSPECRGGSKHDKK